MVHPRLIRKGLYLGTLILIFFYHAMGIGFLSQPEIRLQFYPWIFWTLLFTMGLVLIWDQSNPKGRTVWVMGLIFLIGFGIEGIGVATGKIFGSYRYGRSLGPQFFSVPLLIGLNWCWLVYATASIFHALPVPRWMGVVGSSAGMVLYDFFLESVAPRLDMWTWSDGIVPLRNFIAWSLLSLCFHGILVGMKIRVRNPMARWVFLIQFGFFVALRLFLTKG